MYGLGATPLANAIFRQEGTVDSSGNWIPSSLGYRLNNPGNLNYAGQPGCHPTNLGNGLEAQCDSLADGIAATERQLQLDAGRGLTLAQRLSTWATGNREAYVTNVSGWLGVSPDTPLSDLLGGSADKLEPVPVELDTAGLFDLGGSSDDGALSAPAMLVLGLAGVGLLWAVLD